MKHKHYILGAFLVLSSLALAGTVKIGASPVPHAEILQEIQKDLQAEGVTLDIMEFTDYVTPNIALAEGDLDANFFQHKVYLDKFAEERGLKLETAGNVHIEPLALYSKKIKDVKDLKKKATILIPNDPSNGGRALILLHNKGVIKLQDPTNLYATEFDIVENPKRLKIKAVEAAQLARVLEDVDAAVINGNYAFEAGLNPNKDALIIEGKESPYANIIAVREGDTKKADIQKLMKSLQSEKVKKFIQDKYKGAVLPAF